jgi:acetyl-CoA acetyltransferase
MSFNNVKIVGVGQTPYSKNSGRSVLSLALEACLDSINDSGIPSSEVDGVVCYGMGDSVTPAAVATGLGLEKVRYTLDHWGGGNASCNAIISAAMAIQSGLANSIIVFRAMNGRSGYRLGGTGREDTSLASGDGQFTAPFGYLSFAQYHAMFARRHMIEYGTTSEQLGAIAVACRKHALLNDRAMMKKPMSMEDYLESRMIADPLRLYDICLETDGACAVLLTNSERAINTKKKPISILAGASGGGPQPGLDYTGFIRWKDYTTCYAHYIAEDLWGMAGITPEDVDVAMIYDCFTISVILQLEGLGFCKPGEGGHFVENGRIELGGELPINTHGGLLSEGYIHGLNHTVEAVRQLRGECGPRQVKDAKVALCTGFGTTTGSAVLLTDQ